MERETKLISVNVGLPRIVMNNGDPVATGIFKEPVAIHHDLVGVDPGS